MIPALPPSPPWSGRCHSLASIFTVKKKKKKKRLAFNLPLSASQEISLKQVLRVWDLVWENEADLDRRSDSRVSVLFPRSHRTSVLNWTRWCCGWGAITPPQHVDLTICLPPHSPLPLKGLSLPIQPSSHHHPFAEVSRAFLSGHLFLLDVCCTPPLGTADGAAGGGRGAWVTAPSGSGGGSGQGSLKGSWVSPKLNPVPGAEGCPERCVDGVSARWLVNG